MATKADMDTMLEIELVVNAWKSNQTPAWRAIQKIGAITIEYQKAEWKREHGN